MFALEFPPINEVIRWQDLFPTFNKIALIAVLATLITVVLFWVASRRDPLKAPKGVRNVVEAIRDTADRLGNTAAICRRSYVHPVVVEAYLDPRLRGALLGAAEAAGSPPAGTTRREELAVVRLLERRLGRDAARVRNGRNGQAAAQSRAKSGATSGAQSATR